MIRYRVHDLPVQGAGAFLPPPTMNPVASSYGLVHVYGAPGTLPVPSPHPKATPDFSFDPATVSSHVAPDVIFPSIYIPSVANMGPSQHFGMWLRRFTPMPVPAIAWVSIPKRAMGSKKVGGRRQIPWPRAFQRFPTR